MQVLTAYAAADFSCMVLGERVNLSQPQTLLVLMVLWSSSGSLAVESPSVPDSTIPVPGPESRAPDKLPDTSHTLLVSAPRTSELGAVMENGVKSALPEQTSSAPAMMDSAKAPEKQKVHLFSALGTWNNVESKSRQGVPYQG